MHESRNYGEKNAGTDEVKKNQKIQKLKKNKTSKTDQALSLPTLCNMNPRSVYNKVDEFHAFVEEEEVDLLFMSGAGSNNQVRGSCCNL